MPTKEQITKIEELRNKGYIWDKKKSMSTCAVVMVKGSDTYIFGLDGSIAHNPDLQSIKC